MPPKLKTTETKVASQQVIETCSTLFTYGESPNLLLQTLKNQRKKIKHTHNNHCHHRKGKKKALALSHTV
jgi:hypothetical protein